MSRLTARKARIRSTRRYRQRRELDRRIGNRRRRLLKAGVMFAGWCVFALLIVFAVAMSGA